jgi:hypothetical protein
MISNEAMRPDRIIVAEQVMKNYCAVDEIQDVEHGKKYLSITTVRLRVWTKDNKSALRKLRVGFSFDKSKLKPLPYLRDC